MNTRSTMRLAAGFAATGLAIGALAGCAAGGDQGGEAEAEDVTITWWHNATSGPLPAVWEEVAAEFEAANPGVKVEQTGYQNEDLQRTLIPNALSAGDPPDLFQVWPGGEIRDQVENGYLMPLDDAIGDAISSVGATVNPWQVDGETYAVPFTFGIEGFWYNTDLFEQAGIDAPPETLDELKDAVGKLRDAGITPIAVGAGDKWPAAHWWYQFALHSCSPETLQAAAADFDFSDPCFDRRRRGARGLHRHQPVPGRLPRHPRPDRRGQLGGPRRERPGGHGAHGPLERGRHRRAHARRGGPRVPRLVPVPRDRGIRGRPGRRARRRRRLRMLR